MVTNYCDFPAKCRALSFSRGHHKKMGFGHALWTQSYPRGARLYGKRICLFSIRWITSQDPRGNRQLIPIPIQTDKVETATSNVTETAERAKRTDVDRYLVLDRALIDDEELRQEQFYTLQQYMDSVLIYEQPSQIIARLEREERDL